MFSKSSQRSLVEEDPTPASSPHSIVLGLQSSHDAAVEEAWKEKVQREGIRLEDEPWYMTLPIAIECRKSKAYYEKEAREDQNPRNARRAQNMVDWGQLMQEQIIFAASGERTRISPEAARAREEQFARETEVLTRRILSTWNYTAAGHEAEKDNAGGEDAPRKKRYKGKKRAQKTQPGSSTEPATPSGNKPSSKDELPLEMAHHLLVQPPQQDWSLAVPVEQTKALIRALMLSLSEK